MLVACHVIDVCLATGGLFFLDSTRLVPPPVSYIVWLASIISEGINCIQIITDPHFPAYECPKSNIIDGPSMLFFCSSLLQTCNVDSPLSSPVMPPHLIPRLHPVVVSSYSPLTLHPSIYAISPSQIIIISPPSQSPPNSQKEALISFLFLSTFSTEFVSISPIGYISSFFFIDVYID